MIEKAFQIKYSPINMAYFVVFYDSVLRIFNTREEAEQYVQEIYDRRLGAN